jgi:hypothetical protein
LAVAALLIGRESILRAAGWILVADDPVHAADVIVVALDAGEAGALEAADLVHRGKSSRVALFSEPADEVDRELKRRGLGDESELSRRMRLLRALGVERIESIPHQVVGTEDEGRVLPIWCDEQQLHSVIVVTSADHARRLRRIFHRAMKGRATTVMIRRTGLSDFDPDRWWHTRDGIRTEIIEVEKLLFDVLRHPIS